MQFFKFIIASMSLVSAASHMAGYPTRCGIQNNGMECGSDNPLGACCSEFGYCGKTDAHCKPIKGCQSGCAPDDMPGYSDSNRCGTANKGLLCNPKGQFGPCCSAIGYCGSGDDYCLPARGCQSGCEKEDPIYSTNDRCGSANKGLLCNPKGDFGPCCSEFGYCGSSDIHCLPINGCQSGCSSTKPPTSSKPPTTPSSSAPASSSTAAPSSSVPSVPSSSAPSVPSSAPSSKPASASVSASSSHASPSKSASRL